MRFKTLIVGGLAAFAWTGTTVSASAQVMEGFYVRADAAFSLATNPNIRDLVDTDHVIGGPGEPGTLQNSGSGYAAGAGAGVKFNQYLRGDVTYTYRGGYHFSESDQLSPPTVFKADLSSHALMVTGYADFPIGYPNIVPFAGIGIGWNQTKLSNFFATGDVTGKVPDGTRNDLAWQATLGAGFLVTEGITIDVFVRYFDGGHAETGAGNVTIGGEGVVHYSGAGATLHTFDFGVSLRVPLDL
jgi:opacity protein-like surface antigen